LPLKLVHHNGADFRLGDNPTKILVDNDSKYLENYSNPEYIFTSWSGRQLLLKSFTLGVRLKKSFGYPIGEGLIFAANKLSDLSDLSKWNNMSFKEYCV